jgi:hypothetical protein
MHIRAEGIIRQVLPQLLIYAAEFPYIQVVSQTLYPQIAIRVKPLVKD